MAHRWGTTQAARARIAIAFAGSIALLAGREDVYYLAEALTVFLLRMGGLTNPLGTKITLQPFGQKAGAASALFGFLQMGWRPSPSEPSLRW